MYTINLLQYYIDLALTWAGQYIMYLWNEFMGFAPIIKIAVVMVTLSCLITIGTVLRIWYNAWRNRKWRRQYNKFEDRYGEGIKQILSGELGNEMSRQQVIDALELDDDQQRNQGQILKNFRERLTFARLLFKKRIAPEASHNTQKNLGIIMSIFGVQPFLEDLVNKGSTRRKAEALVMMRVFKVTINQWIANQLRTSKRYRLRRLSNYVSIMSSSNSDLGYFESEFFDQNCCIYDEIQLGYVLQRRRAMKRKMPNLAQLAAAQSNPSTQAVFVRLLRNFEQTEYCADLEDLFNSTSSKELITEICRTWGYLGYLPSEEMMNDIILTQPEDTKVAIMHALTRLHTGKSLQTLVDGYRNSGDQHVRYEALRCLYNYGPAGYAKFKELELTASSEDKRIFEFFNNPLTRDKTKLKTHDKYESVGEENLFSVV